MRWGVHSYIHVALYKYVWEVLVILPLCTRHRPGAHMHVERMLGFGMRVACKALMMQLYIYTPFVHLMVSNE